MNEIIFARLDEYADLWAYEPIRFRMFRHQLEQMNPLSILELKAPPVVAVEKIAAAGGKAIARIQLRGVLMKGQNWFGGTSTEQAIRDIRQAAGDSDVSSILLQIDSPGGTVSGTANLGDEIKAAAKQKPVVAHIDDLGASAAYWAASQASRIIAGTTTTLIGSIGTIQPMTDTSVMEEKMGIKDVSAKTGPLKGIGYGPITPEQIAHVQEIVDKVQLSFDVAVKKGRGMNDKQLMAVRHGGVFLAADALSNGLIDAIQPLSKTIAELSRASSGSDSRRAETENDGRSIIAGTLPMRRQTLPMLSV